MLKNATFFYMFFQTTDVKKNSGKVLFINLIQSFIKYLHFQHFIENTI